MAAIQIAATAADGCSENTNEFTLPSESSTALMWMGRDVGAALDIDAGFIFRSTGIPQGATILTCTITLVRAAAGLSPLAGGWWGYAVDSPTNFNAADVHRVSDHHTRTTATVADNVTGDPATHVSPSLVSIAQEIVNRAGFAGDLGFSWRNTGTSDGWFFWTDYTTTPGSAALLTITWTTGAPTIGRAWTHPHNVALQQRFLRR